MPDSRTTSVVLQYPRPLSFLWAGLLVVLTILVTSGQAAAHDVVSSSDPADGATVSVPPTQVSVTFDQTPQAGLSTLTVVGPDGARREVGPSTTTGNIVTVPVGSLPAAGEYQIGYRIVSSDGHPTSGSLSFTLTTPSPPSSAGATGGTSAPGPLVGAPPDPGGHHASQPSAAPASNRDAGSGSAPTWVFVVVAVLVVAGAVALVLRRRV